MEANGYKKFRNGNHSNTVDVVAVSLNIDKLQIYKINKVKFFNM